MIKFTVQIRIPGYLDAEDELSNLLQDEGAEEDFEWKIEADVRSWIAHWLPRLQDTEIKVEVEQE